MEKRKEQRVRTQKAEHFNQQIATAKKASQ